MLFEDTIDETVCVLELLHVFGTCDDDGPRAEGGNRDLLTGSDCVSTSVAFTWTRANTDPWWRCGWAGLVPEEFRIHALVDRGFIRAPEAIILHENLVEAVTANGLADVVVGVHHADVEFGDAGLGGLFTGPDSSTFVECNELCEGCTGHGFAADPCHLEPAVLEDLNIRLLETGIGVIETEAEDQGGLVEEALLGLCGCMENVLHAEPLALIAELDLEHALTDPPVGDEGTIVIELLEIGDCTQMSSDCHCADTKRSCSCS